MISRVHVTSLVCYRVVIPRVHVALACVGVVTSRVHVPRVCRCRDLARLARVLAAPGPSGGAQDQEPGGAAGGDADEETRDQAAPF